MVETAVIVKALAGVVLPIENALFALLPLLIQRNARAMAAAYAAASGVMLGIGAAHLVPAAVSDLKHVDTNMFPLAYYLVFVGYLIVLACEQLSPAEDGSTQTCCQIESGDTKKKPETCPECEAEGESQPLSTQFAPKSQPPQMRRAVFVLVAMAVHDFITGMALGAGSGTSETVALAVALAAHEWACGGGLSLVFLGNCHLGKRAAAIMIGIFCLVAPIGIGVGAGVAEAVDGNKNAMNIANGVLMALAAGTFFYVGIHCLLLASLASRQDAALKIALLALFGTAAAASAMICDMGNMDMDSMDMSDMSMDMSDMSMDMSGMSMPM